MHQNYASLSRKTKAACVYLWIHLLLPITEQMLSHCKKNKSSAHIVGIWENKHHNPKSPPSSFFPPAFTAEHNVIWYGIPLSSFQMSCAGCIPSQSLVNLQPTHTGRVGRVRGSLDDVPALFSRSQNSSVLSELFQPQMLSTHSSDYYEEN